MTTEIPQKFWAPFCEQLRNRYRGAVSIRWIPPDGVADIVAQDVPLQDLVFEKRYHACSDRMTVEAGQPGEHPLQHQIIEPFCVVLRQNEESGRYYELEILGETGKTEITFRPGIDSQLLEKLAA